MEAIQHVIHLSPENRSFHNVLGYLENHHDHYNYDVKGKRIYCSAVPPMSGGDSIIHDIGATMASIRGINGEPMSGFVLANQKGIYNTYAFETAEYQADPQQIMGYVEHGAMPILHALADSFCVCTRWFSSCPTETFPNRSYMLAGTSSGRSNNVPKKIWEMLFDTTTIFDRLEAANISWTIYYPNYLDIIDNLDVDKMRKFSYVRHFSALITDLETGNLPVYSYVELDTDEDSIASLVPYIGQVEAFIGKIYDTLRNSSYWENTLVIISYDEHGGFYDPIVPPPCPPPDDETVMYSPSNVLAEHEFKFDSYGVRVPALLISPWIDRGFDDTIYDHTSILAFLEHRFGLEPLTDRDRNANYSFKFRSTPRQDGMPENLSMYASPEKVPQGIANDVLAFFTGMFSDFSKLPRQVIAKPKGKGHKKHKDSKKEK